MSGRRLRSVTLRARLTWTLVGVSLFSVLALGIINYMQSRTLLDESVREQLEAVAEGRAAAIENGLDRLQAQVAAVARDEGVVDALAGLDAGFADVERTQRLTPDQEAELEQFYQENLLELFDEAGLEAPPIAEVLPTTDAGRYLQYQYLVENPFPAGERAQLDQADEGSAYSAVHGVQHPFLRGLAETLGQEAPGDLLLISAETEQIVYTVDKRVDFGTDLAGGPYADTALADAVLDGLSAAGVGEAVFVDYQPYLPAGGSPALFVAASVQSDRELIGAIALEIPADALTTLTTADGRFDDLGLGRTGEAYVVGGDRLMRSDSRLYLEDPDAYLQRFRDEGFDEQTAGLIEFSRSTAFLQPVDNEPVASALDGETFAGVTTSYLGDETLAAAIPVGVDDLDWVVVAEVQTNETDNALNEYLERILLIAAILTPIVALVAYVLSRGLTRPVPPLVGAAATVAGGDLGIELADLGRNEVGDVALRLNRVTARLREQRRSLAGEEAQIVALLEATLPPRLVDQVRSGRQDYGDIVDTATMVAVSAVGTSIDDGDDEELHTLMREVAGALERTAAENGLERVRSSSEEHLFVAGLGGPSYGADAACRFVLDALAAVDSLSEESEHEVELSAGLATGEVAAGVLGDDQVSFGVWGDPPAQAMTIDTIAESGEILLHPSVIDQLEQRWLLGRPRELLEWAGDTIAVTPLERPEAPAAD